MSNVISLIHYICFWIANLIYVNKFQVNTVAFEAMRQNVFSQARVIVISVRSDLKPIGLAISVPRTHFKFQGAEWYFSFLFQILIEHSVSKQ